MYVSITPQELHDRLEKEPTIILDVRGVGAFNDWHIQHQHAELLNIQTSKLKADGPAAYPEIPQGKEVVVLCAQGNASQEASEILSENGYQPLNLTGGMQAWSEFYYSVPVVQSEGLKLLQVIRPAKGCLSYMLISGDDAIVVDAGRHQDYYATLAQKNGAKVQHVFDTHCHADHISGGPALAESESAEYWIGPTEMKGANMTFSPLEDGKVFSFGDAKLEVLSIPTPGHTPGSTSFLVNDKYLLSGDTVFVSGIGRPDLGGKAEEWSELLYQTVVAKLNKLSDDIIILPAHFADISEFTDAGYVGAVFSDIRSSNEFFQEMSKEDFTDKMVNRAGQTPPNYTTIVQINRGEYTPTATETSDLEIGPNRCAVKHLAG